MRKWAAEVAGRAKFASMLPPDQAVANPGSLPVPCLIINNKADLRGITPLPWNVKTCHAFRGTLYTDGACSHASELAPWLCAH